MTIETADAGQAATTTETSATAPAVEATPAAGAETTAPPDPAAAAAAAYSPTYKYKYVDPEGKDVEGELPDWVKPLVKTADFEKQVRELFEKSASLDFIKGGRAKAQTQAAEVGKELGELKAGIESLRKCVQSGDFDSFFEMLEIPQQRILQYALQVAQREKMTPEQRQAYDASVSQRRQLQMLQEQNRSLQDQHTQAAVQARSLELDTVLSRPEVNAMAAAFDGRLGRPGAFRAEVVRRGQHAFYTSGQDVPAETLVAEMMATFGAFVNAAPAASGSAGGVVTPPAHGKPTIPNIAGKGASPVKRVPRSIDDLRKIAADMASAGT